MRRLFLFCSILVLTNFSSSSRGLESSEPENANSNYEFALCENEPMLVTGSTNCSISIPDISYEGNNLLLLIPGKIEKYRKFADGHSVFYRSE
ncbi:hypothetical protein LEP1GSC047_0015 [Leptospira inadai serovar Lyme str. 10]|uniref:Uncharacterized protein n=2 Tax=Leptospira inadai serovar Lyme TaxID=293084 RepID=V6HE08_9LEPT|nr:hypothetical protein LEP1GSC047_0015 [Leptospira inadai serovar Lyme str. 10]PNV74046.1 hypothetical protein BES34_015975 [Leptospira inadai serovar Lyme]